MNDNQLIEYINALRETLNDAQIRDDLLKRGILPDRVEWALNFKKTKSQLAIKTIKIIQGVKQLIVNNRRKLAIGASAVVALVIIGVSVFYLYDFSKISWAPGSDSNINFIIPTNLTFKVDAKDNRNNDTDKIAWKVTDGTLVNKSKKEVSWSLPNKSGIYTITAIVGKDKKVSKDIEVIDNAPEGIASIQLPSTNDPNADNDQDGIINSDEDKYKTDKVLADTDSDGLIDIYEIEVSKTDPLKSDTDGDTLSDSDELELILNPLKSDSKGDGVNDSKRTLSYKAENTDIGASADITGKGNIASTTIDSFTNDTFKSVDGIVGNVYDFYTPGTIEKAKISINYDKTALANSGINEDDLSIYYFNENDNKFEKIVSTVDKTSSVVSADVIHFSKYFIGDIKKMIPEISTEIMFVIDNSGSMFSKAAFGSDNTDENDPEFKRVDLSVDIIDGLVGNYKFGAGRFAGSYDDLSPLTTDKESVKNKIKSMKTIKQNFDGTDIGGALEGGLSQFSSVNSALRRYVVLLTDGGDDNTQSYFSNNTIESAIKSAKDNNVAVITIGLGNSIDEDLLIRIADETGGKYYHSSDIEMLDETFNNISSSVNYNLVDTNDDKIVDSQIITNSNFNVNRDGFNFKNYSSDYSLGGNCYGMATFVSLYFQKKLPMKLDDLTLTTGVQNVGVINDKATKTVIIPGYNISSNKFILEKDPLGIFKFTDLSFLHIKSGDGSSSYYNSNADKNGLVKIADGYRKQLSNFGFEFYQIKSNNKFFEIPRISLSSKNFKNNVDQDDKNVLNAINRLFYTQISYVPDSKLDESIIEESVFSLNSNAAYSKLSNGISNNEAPVISMTYSNGGHAVNAIKIINDTKNPNKLKIEIYDNNFPGEKKYIDVTRVKQQKHYINYMIALLKREKGIYLNDYQYTFEYQDKPIKQLLISI